MASPVPPHRFACALCARRKVKCDKLDRCTNCSKANVKCVYEENPTMQRSRKRPAEEDHLAQIARYEELLRKHNIHFAQDTHTWVPSGFENDSKDHPALQQLHANMAADPPSPSKAAGGRTEQCLWSRLSPELKHPPAMALHQLHEPMSPTAPSLESIVASSKSELHELHPEPRHIYRFWQIFVEAVNPLLKIVHVPTLQQRILDASWDLVNAPKSLVAMMFAIYSLAVTSISLAECEATFGATKTTLLTRYRTATLRALIAANFLSTRDMEVLQAFTLFLLADPDSDSTYTLTGAAIRIGQKMGLYRESIDATPSFFENELRTRLWWQLHGLDSRARAMYAPAMRHAPTFAEFGDVRLPSNINDVDLHPDMNEPPTSHHDPTEMICVLMKFEVFEWFRTSPLATKFFESVRFGASGGKGTAGKLSLELQDEAINELERIYHSKFLTRINKRIPLHNLANTIAKLSIANLRFKIHHPRGRPYLSEGGAYMTQDESDMLFDAAVTSWQMNNAATDSVFSTPLFINIHLTTKFQLDVYVYVISELRRRVTGERVTLAWELVTTLYHEHPELIDDTDNAFVVSLGDLTLEAWDARCHALLSAGQQSSDATPSLIHLLREKRQKANDATVQPAPLLDHGDSGIHFWDANNLNWDYWSDFLQI